MSHPSATEIEDFVSGASPPSTTLTNHLSTCDACAELVRDVARVEAALHEVGEATHFCVACGCVATKARCSSCGAALYVRDYRVESVLASGPLGRVYAAVDSAGVRVAVKELAFVGTASSDALAAFEREAQVLERLTHAGIPRFVDSFSEGRGVEARAYLVQELIEGESLATRLGRQSFTEAEVVEIARQVAEILVYLQSLSPMVFHRDIKPANLIRRPDGSIALVDFGAARDLGSTAGATVVGTFGYMPVEQLAGIVDATTDLHALGATLWHLMTRIEPWRLWSDPLLQRRANVSPTLRRFLDKLVARDSRRRFSGARAARDALTGLPGRWSMMRPILATRTTWWAVAAALLLAGATGGGIAARRAWVRHHQRPVPEPRATTSSVPDPLDGLLEPMQSDHKMSLDEWKARLRAQYVKLAAERRDLEHVVDLVIRDEQVVRSVNNQDYKEVTKALAKFVVSKQLDGLVLVDAEGHVVAAAGALDAGALGAERDDDKSELARSSIRSIGQKSYLVASGNVTYFGRSLGELVAARPTDARAQTVLDDRPTQSLDEDAAQIEGSYDKGVITKIIRRHLREVKDCYESELPAKPRLAGRMLIQFGIAEGKVIDASVQSTTMRDPKLEGCVVQAIRTWEFPKAPGGGTVLVSYPFVFGATK